MAEDDDSRSPDTYKGSYERGILILRIAIVVSIIGFLISLKFGHHVCDYIIFLAGIIFTIIFYLIYKKFNKENYQN